MIFIFQEYQFLLKLLGLDAYGGRANIFGQTIFSFLLISSVLLPLIFFVLNVRSRFDLALSTMPPIFGLLAVPPIYFHFVVNRERIFSLLDELQAIVIERTNIDETNKVIYAAADQYISYGTKMIMKGIILFGASYLSPFLVVAFHWCLGKYTIESWFLFFPLWTPFQQNSTLSYAIVALLEIFFIASVMCVLGTAISLLMGCMVFANTCFLDIKFIFARIDGFCEQKNSDTLQVEFITEIFVLHGRVNGFMGELKDLMSFIVLVTLTPWTMCTCFSLFMIATYSGMHFLYDLQMPFISTICPLTLAFVFFYLGQKFHSQTKAVSDQIYNVKWYRYTRRAQRIVQLMLMRSQRPFFLGAYGIMTLTLGNYVVLLKWIYSAFMLLIRFK